MNFTDVLGLRIDNNSGGPVVGKPEQGGLPPFVVPPGGIDPQPQDGLYLPGGRVVKTTDNIDAVVNPDGSVSTSGPIVDECINAGLGGDVTPDWLKRHQDWPSQQQAQQVMEDWLKANPNWPLHQLK